MESIVVVGLTIGVVVVVIGIAGAAFLEKASS